MSEEIFLIGIVAFMMVVTYLTRLLPFKIRLPQEARLLNAVIEYIPVSIIASITLPAVIAPAGQFNGLLNADALAAIPVAFIAWRTRNLIYSVIGGVIAHIVIQKLFL